MNKFGMRFAAGVLALAGFAFALGGCSSGDTDGGKAGDEEFPGSEFVSDDRSGTIELDVNDELLDIGEITGYKVIVRDSTGNGVPFIQIACDSEKGVAIIEPTTGIEATGAEGLMSGKLACTRPGSHLFGCRLAIRGNKRRFTTIRCSGEVPPGFEGFPGAAGGGLGGGVQVDPDNDNVEEVRIVAISATDGDPDTSTDGTSTTSIDVLQGICSTGGAGTAEAEDFTDTIIKVTVLNNTDVPLTFSKLTYSVDNADGAGTQFNSKDLAVLQDTVQANGGTADYSALVFRAFNGRKFFADSTFAIPTSLGFRSITFRLFGENALGEEVVLAARTTLSFGNFNRCETN